MALIKCKKCGKEISDKAQVCPGCGEPVINDSSQDAKKDEKQNVKKKKSHKIWIGVAIILGIVAVLIALESRKTPHVSEKNENGTVEDAVLQNEEKDTDKTENKAENIEMSWEDGTAPTEVGGGESIAKITETKVVNSSFGTLLIMSFEYSNNSDDARNFINDDNCNVKPFQNGVALETPGFTSEEGVYDSNEAYSAVKNGGVINSQLAWILNDNVSPIEIEFGKDENYHPDFIEIIVLSGGTKTEENVEEKTAKSDYKITWNNEVPEKIGNENEQAFIKNVAVVDSANYGRVLVIDIDFINNLENTRNLINDYACSISVYQNGVALDTPGVTSDGDYFNYNDAFTAVKKGGKVSTQLVWSLKDESPVEIEFGLDENFNVQYTASFTFAK